MILSIIGIVIGLVAIILVFHTKKDQEITNDLVDSDVSQNTHALLALQQEFTQYQVDTERKISELEKAVEIKAKNTDRQLNRLTKNLPVVIRNVVGHIEFAKPLDKK